MIASRFRSVVMSAAVAGAALGCYLVSLKVASERNELDRVERAIGAAQADIRYLQTEIGTRARLTQLERWNADVLALAAPGPRQFVRGTVQLAALRGAGLPGVLRPDGAPAVPPAATTAQPNVVAASFQAPAPKAAASTPEPARGAAVAKRPSEARPAEPREVEAALPLLRHATYQKPAAAEPQVQAVALLDDRLLGEIARKAKAEATGGRTRK
jgi:hypothetical protein